MAEAGPRKKPQPPSKPPRISKAGAATTAATAAAETEAETEAAAAASKASSAAAARPYPPAPGGMPKLLTLEPGVWWRVHPFDASTGRYAAHQFNDSGLGNARFSPLFAAAGGGPPGSVPTPASKRGRTLVPTLYAAATLDAALMETVLHDIPYPSQGHIFDLDHALQAPLQVSRIQIRQPLQLLDLSKIGLQRMGLKPSQLFETDADDYPRTRAWAQALHAGSAPAQGLLWMSARQPEAHALMLFGDRIKSRSVVVVSEPPVPLRAASVQAALLALLDRLGCGVAPGR